MIDGRAVVRAFKNIILCLIIKLFILEFFLPFFFCSSMDAKYWVSKIEARASALKLQICTQWPRSHGIVSLSS